jgi:hypothetical protein
MWDFDIGKTFGILMKTLPFIIFRMLIYMGVAFGYLLVTGIGAAIGYMLTSLAEEPGAGAFIGGAIGFAVSTGIMYWLREYILYLVKAGHIAVMVELLDGKTDLPGGKGQIDYAQSRVRERFVEASILFGLDQLLKGVLRGLNRGLSSIGSFVPIPGLEGLMGIVSKILTLSLTYTDEIIIAYNFRVRSDNAWATSKDAVILYAQNYKSMLKNAFFLMLGIWLITLVIFLVVLLPVGALFSFFPGNVSFWGFVIALVFAWCFKAALVEPFAVAAMMQVYFKAIEGQVPNAEWDQKLSSISGKFRKLKKKAEEGPTVAPA